jgi:hypothetical protein
VAYIFLDESGDLGFKPSSSKWLVLTIILTNNHRKIEKVIKKIHKGLQKKHKRVKELHAYHTDAINKKRLLQLLAKLEDFKILCIVLNKKKVYIDLQNQKNYLYNYTANILLDRLHDKQILNPKDTVELYIDQKETNKFLRQNFEQYLENTLGQWKNDQIKIKIKPSHTEKCLQAADFVSWAIFRKYEQNDYEYYEIIKNKIIEERLLFP